MLRQQICILKKFNKHGINNIITNPPGRRFSLRSIISNSNAEKDGKKNAPATEKINPPEESHEDDSGYMRRRLEQLREDAIASDPSSRAKKLNQELESLPVGSLVDQNVDMAKIYSKLEQKKFENQYASELLFSKIPSYADKLSADVALSRPWSGGTGASDVAKVSMAHNGKSGSTKAIPVPVLRKKESISERINRVREKSLDYSLMKHSKQAFEEDPGFKERYRERLLGPEQSGLASGRVSFAATAGSIKGMADAKIEEARARGEFDNLPRGKQIDDGYRPNAYMDRTDFHLNNILKKQDVKLPWIEKQGSVFQEIAKFREDLKRDWLLKAVHIIDDMNAGRPTDVKLQSAKYYSENYQLLRDLNWELQKRRYFGTSLRKLNDSIRGYNLQAPMPSQIFYLIPDKELERCYKDSAKDIIEEAKRFFLGSINGHTRQEQPQKPYRVQFSQPQQSLGLLFFNLFKRK